MDLALLHSHTWVLPGAEGDPIREQGPFKAAARHAQASIEQELEHGSIASLGTRPHWREVCKAMPNHLDLGWGTYRNIVRRIKKGSVTNGAGNMNVISTPTPTPTPTPASTCANLLGVAEESRATTSAAAEAEAIAGEAMVLTQSESELEEPSGVTCERGGTQW